MADFETMLHRYGLMQYGRFAAPDGTITPFKLSLDLLPSYPDALKAAADEIMRGIELHNYQVERLLCPFDTVPLATLVSQQTGVPLVWSRGRGEPAVHDLVGAYDTNHPTLFLVNAYLPWEDHTALLSAAHRVGLKTAHAYALVDCENPTVAYETNPSWVATISIDALADIGAEADVTPATLAERVTSWFYERRTTQ